MVSLLSFPQSNSAFRTLAVAFVLSFTHSHTWHGGQINFSSTGPLLVTAAHQPADARRIVSNQGQNGTCWAHAIASSIVSMFKGGLQYDENGDGEGFGDGEELFTGDAEEFGAGQQGAPNSAHTTLVRYIIRNVIGSSSCFVTNYEKILSTFGMRLEWTNDYERLQWHLNERERAFGSAAFSQYRTPTGRLFDRTLGKAGTLVKAFVQEHGPHAPVPVIDQRFVLQNGMYSCNFHNPSDWREHEPNTEFPTHACDRWFRTEAHNDCSKCSEEENAWGWVHCRQTCDAMCGREQEQVPADRWDPGWNRPGRPGLPQDFSDRPEQRILGGVLLGVFGGLGSAIGAGVSAVRDGWTPDSATIRCEEWFEAEWGAKRKCDACKSDWAKSECSATCFVRCDGGSVAGHLMEISAASPDERTLTLRNSWGASWAEQGYLTLSEEAMRLMARAEENLLRYGLISWQDHILDQLRDIAARRARNGEQDISPHDFVQTVISTSETVVYGELKRLLRGQRSNGEAPAGLPDSDANEDQIRRATEHNLYRNGVRPGCALHLDIWNPGNFDEGVTPRRACGAWWSNSEWGAEKENLRRKGLRAFGGVWAPEEVDSDAAGDSAKCQLLCSRRGGEYANHGLKQCAGTCETACAPAHVRLHDTWQVEWGNGDSEGSCDQWWHSKWGADRNCKECWLSVLESKSNRTFGVDPTFRTSRQPSIQQRSWGCDHCAATCHRHCGDEQQLLGLPPPFVFRLLGRDRRASGLGAFRYGGA